jgi:DMSO/TMAO reductase YedYZ molybdopterin-dependent catalytic subunit
MSRETRRKFLQSLGALSAAGCFGDSLGAEPERDDQPLSTVPFVEEGDFPLEQTIGAGLGRRRALDLAARFPAPPGPPDFFLRTGAPELRLPTHEWRVRVHGLVDSPVEVDIAELRAASVPQGPQLLECAGNSRAAHFGYMGVAGFGGVPVAQVLARARPKAGATHVLVSGLDHPMTPERASGGGVGWIFPRQLLQESGAFLATEMNGVPLAPDHGFPLRLVVPGWYGCVAIKWVNEIAYLAGDGPPTAHMQDFASLIQPVSPRLVREFRPATIEAAAVATRVSKLTKRGSPAYRVSGIAWGGGQPIRALGIRFTPDAVFGRVDAIADGDGSTWRQWSHVFEPPRRGRYRIELSVWEPRLPAWRLDQGHYGREVVLG